MATEPSDKPSRSRKRTNSTPAKKPAAKPTRATAKKATTSKAKPKPKKKLAAKKAAAPASPPKPPTTASTKKAPVKKNATKAQAKTPPKTKKKTTPKPQSPSTKKAATKISAVTKAKAPASKKPAARKPATKAKAPIAKKPATAKKASPTSPKGIKKLPVTDRLKIVVVSAECAPFAKTGGLADAVAGLSKALHQLGHDVRVVLPLYAQVDYDKHGLTFNRSACIHMGHGEENWVAVHQGKLDGHVPVWFIDHGRYFMRPGIYYDGSGDYTDNAFRFGLLCKAAMQLCKDYDFTPDIMHLHDWSAAPAAALLKTWDRADSPLSKTASVLTIHNIGHQGVYDASALGYYGLGWEHFTAEKFEDHGKMNLLKAGVHFADAITTVSPSHAEEIKHPEGGKGLALFLNDRAQDLSGILNGVDDAHWHPETDTFLPVNFSAKKIAGKAACKALLQERFGLEQNPDIPLFGIVSRFAPQKGLELLRESLPRLMGERQYQIVTLGSGDSNTESFFNWLHDTFRERAGVYVGFSDELCHLIEGGSDFFLMPSLYEPCGLNQIYSMAYGTLPVVRATGGLEDTVDNYDSDTGEGTGFKFWEPTADALHHTLHWVIDTYEQRPHHIAAMQQRAMAQSFPWTNAARTYSEVYQKARTNRARW